VKNEFIHVGRQVQAMKPDTSSADVTSFIQVGRTYPQHGGIFIYSCVTSRGTKALLLLMASAVMVFSFELNTSSEDMEWRTLLN
jgi:hypothetical protein